MELIRLMPDDAGYWRMYAEFEARVINFGLRSGTRFNSALLRKQLKQRFVNTPDLAGYFLIVEDYDHAETPIAHICSWLEEAGPGEEGLVVHIYQMEADAHISITEVIPTWMKAIDDWATNINSLYMRGGSQVRVSRARFWTQKDAEMFARYCRKFGVEAVAVSHVLEWSLPAITNPENMLETEEYSHFAKGA